MNLQNQMTQISVRLLGIMPEIQFSIVKYVFVQNIACMCSSIDDIILNLMMIN